MTITNPFLEPSELPYQLPPFAECGPEHFRPAFAAGMDEHWREIEQIATNPQPPTFDNTIAALERAGAILERTSIVFYTLNAADTTDELQAIETEYSGKLSAHQDRILQHEKLFERIDDLHRRRADLGLSEEDAYLLQRRHTAFVRGGAQLKPEDKARLAELNSQLSQLSTKFSQQGLADINDAAVHVTDVTWLDGLESGAISAAAEAAKSRGLEGYLITSQLFSNPPSLASLSNRTLRQQLWEASTSRGPHNAATLLEMVRLRAERARLLGYDHHADYVTADQMAGSAAAVLDRLGAMVPAAIDNAKAEAAELQKFVHDSGENFDLQPWDWSFYSTKLLTEKFDFDPDQLRPYLELDRVLEDGVFFAANKLYGLTITPREDLQGYHPDVRVWEVFDHDGSALGLFLGDFFTRDSKKGGAWMNPLVNQSTLLEKKPVVLNNLNIPKPAEGQPALVSMDFVRTLFHEFGHAIHGLLSACHYPSVSMTSVPRDFVEFPSQVNEMWIDWPEVADNYARHVETGEPLPEELKEKVSQVRSNGQGFKKTEYLASALLDLAWHQLGPDEVPQPGADPAAVVEEFERSYLTQLGFPLDLIAPRYRSGYFQHIFSGGYSAGYYSYVWSEILDADTVEWFKDNGGLDRANGDHFRNELLSRGRSIDPMQLYRNFRGRDPHVEPLLKRHNLQPR
ncbi:M3 family metallopeptidase [Natronoglycomyces albus]|uniref:M3 family metallopeptidase n=1 Tax=Natronoglycomyces albus TaxID=2811108 RepID=A0A895XTE3_9ACTN|nr:M3 family metallopeptidase [Natronoglycomyces albus]QSB06565.1 M3 family metallopeptidase [Natronoglycomyces albus]